ncbi:hypothetical protein [Amycolatopsis sp. cmx-4-83]|uniref:hypothetical protein n=1 Tax=Amycolatopsis sp. cmx-4-83 TaxID=2790940 RepID=UPI00397C3097
MSHADAVKIIAHAAHLADLRAALALIGFHLPAEVEDAEPVEERTEDDTDFFRLPWRRDDGVREDHGHRPEQLLWNWRTGPGEPDDHRPASESDRLYHAPVLPATRPADAVLTGPPPISAVVAAAALRELDRPAELEEPDDALVAAPFDEQIRARLVNREESSRIDIERVVDLLARREPLRRIPYLRRTRTARRIQVVHDIGLHPGPFDADLRQLFRQIDELASGAQVMRTAFRHRLSRGCGSGPIWQWREFRAPSEPSVVVFVTGDSTDAPLERRAELLRYMESLRRRRHRTFGIWFGAPTGPAETDAATSRRKDWIVVSE